MNFGAADKAVRAPDIFLGFPGAMEIAVFPRLEIASIRDVFKHGNWLIGRRQILPG